MNQSESDVVLEIYFEDRFQRQKKKIDFSEAQEAPGFAVWYLLATLTGAHLAS
ncbi:hypothetical protein [Diaphorobacter sp.]|uniref:hypothetical protein n=1 Tax=Diaphorobacter sp. TaxID=1934310 RepID=UPI002587D25A|nr:hypothetical protein [Diaphorobacter sp.]